MYVFIYIVICTSLPLIVTSFRILVNKIADFSYLPAFIDSAETCSESAAT